MTPTVGPAMLAVRTAAEIEPEQRLQAWLIEYADKAPAGKTALAVIKEPRAAWVCSRSVDAMAALAGEVSPPTNSDGFVFIFVPSGSATAYQVQKQAEQWMASRPGEQDGIMEVLFRSERLLWRRGRALCFGTSQMINDMMAAVCRFALCEGDLDRLERQADEACATMENDKHLSNDPRPRDLKRRPHVDAMVRTAVQMQLAYLRIEKALAAPSAADVSGPARRVFVELTLFATAQDRLDRLEEMIDVVLEQYQFLGERLSDYRYYMRENVLIAIIVILLLGQFIVESEPYWRPPVEQFLRLTPPPPPPPVTNPG